MKLQLLAIATLAILSSHVFAGERIVIDPFAKGASKTATGVKKSEQVTVSGPLKLMAMGGAMLTIQSFNYGQLILFSPLDIEASSEKRLREFEATHAIVKISGTLNTVCSERQLATEVMGCRRFDTTKAIAIEKQ